jgi:serine phosphatase RsbU (regulator of sigma subunit)
MCGHNRIFASMPLSTAPTPTTEELQHELVRERFALRSLLDFAQTLTPELGVEGIIRSVLRTIMGKALIQDTFAYVHHTYFPDEVQEKLTGDYLLVTYAGFRKHVFNAQITSEELNRLIESPDEGMSILLPVVTPDQSEIIALLGFGKPLLPSANLDEQKTFVESLSVLTGMALTNAKLFESEKKRVGYESELRLAREIQQSLFPQTFPQVDGLSFAGLVRPSGHVGGDYYDVILLSDSKVLLCVADVVGKGISAALIMSNLQAALRTLIAPIKRGDMPLTQAVQRLNTLIFEHTSPERFITAVFAIIDSQENSVETCVCGHPNPLIINKLGVVSQVTASGIPLGILPDFEFKCVNNEFAHGSTLILYTDGLSEARLSNEDDLIGVQGVEGIAIAQYSSGDSVETFLDKITERTGLEFDDDLTILLARRF